MGLIIIHLLIIILFLSLMFNRKVSVAEPLRTVLIIVFIVITISAVTGLLYYPEECPKLWPIWWH